MTERSPPPGGTPQQRPQGEVLQLPLSDGCEVAARLFMPMDPPRGVLSFVHGLQSHSGWFLTTAGSLARAGFLCLFADRRGTGRNPRDQAGRSSPAVLLRDIGEVDGHARRIAGERDLPEGLPVGLIGHSLGGALATLAVVRGQVRADWLYLISPGLAQKSEFDQAGVWRRMSVAFKVAYCPGRQVKIRIPSWKLTNSAEGQAFVDQDPLRLRRTEARFHTARAACREMLQKTSQRVKCPALLVLAGKDLLVDNQGTQALFQKLCTGPAAVETFDDCGHTLELTPMQPELVPTLLKFLDSVL